MPAPTIHFMPRAGPWRIGIARLRGKSPRASRARSESARRRSPKKAAVNSAQEIGVGFGDQREIELLVEAGFTPVEAIKFATENGAVYLGQQDRIGTLSIGKRADLVVIKGDPSKKIEEIENVETVFKDAVGYDSKKLIDAVRGNVGLR